MYALALVCTLAVASKHAVYGSQVNDAEFDVKCHCVPSQFCLDNDVAINGDGLLDVRYEANNCPNYFEVCCENPVSPLPEIPPSHQEKLPGCGYQSSMVSRILSDSGETQFGELPWSLVIMLREKETGRRKYKCGASLIHPQVVLTAAHCVTDADANEVNVRAGEWDTKSKDEPEPHQDATVQEVVIHPNFHRASLRNDIAILFLSQPFKLTTNVDVICLPESNEHATLFKCFASGWGKDAFRKGQHSSILKKVDLPLIPRKECTKLLRQTRLGKFYNLHRSFICAGGEEKKDTCKGDGGSPLVCAIPGTSDRYVQMGIVSWGIGCGDTNIPGVYVNVALYTKWIDTQLNSRNFDSSYYKYLNR